MTSLPLADHPVRWRRPVHPADIDERRLLAVTNGAAAAGVKTDALVALNTRELDRRAHLGLGAVPALHVLDALGNLPLGYPIPLADLREREERILRSAPNGCVTFDTVSVTRTAQTPVTVAAALVDGGHWQTAIRRSASFAPFTQRVLLREEPPTASQTLEAQVAGIGIWVDHQQAGIEEWLPAEPFVPKYFKAAGWRFAENALRAHLAAGMRGRDTQTAQHACC